MTAMTALPAGLSYIHPEIGHCDHPEVASSPAGTFILFMFTPGAYDRDGIMHLNTAAQCYILKKIDRAGVVHELRRWKSADTAAWLRSHGADPAKEQGKYGPWGLDIDGADVVIVMNYRINSCQTLLPWIEHGLAG